jgi:Protein of unknown function (DUF4232)
MPRVAALAVVVLALLAPTASGRTTTASCKGGQLAGTFKVVAGSAGAGNIVYALVLKNVSTRACSVTGLPQGRLLDRLGKPLPTHVRAAFPGALSAVLVRLAPGRTTRATARFSPDVPGPGEPVTATRCEPVAHWFRVAGQGGGTTRVKMTPATPVCEHGQLQFSAYSVVR